MPTLHEQMRGCWSGQTSRAADIPRRVKATVLVRTQLVALSSAHCPLVRAAPLESSLLRAHVASVMPRVAAGLLRGAFLTFCLTCGIPARRVVMLRQVSPCRAPISRDNLKVRGPGTACDCARPHAVPACVSMRSFFTFMRSRFLRAAWCTCVPARARWAGGCGGGERGGAATRPTDFTAGSWGSKREMGRGWCVARRIAGRTAHLHRASRARRPRRA